MDKNETVAILKELPERIAAVIMPSDRFFDYKGALDFAVKTLEADRWIPVSERLPERQKPNDDIYNTHCSDYVLVCIEWWNKQKVIEIACYCFDDEEWEYHGSDEAEVIAWQPLPKPYESEAESLDYQRAVEDTEYCERHEPTYNPDDGSM